MERQFITATKRKSMTEPRAVRIFAAANGRCHICTQQIRDGEQWEVEHVVALADGGPDTDANCAPAHVRCHKGKTATEAAARAKTRDIISQGWASKRKSRPMPGSKASGLRKKVDGTVERRG